MKTQTVKTLQLAALAADNDAQLRTITNEVVDALHHVSMYARMGRIVQFSVEVEREYGGSDKWQYARRDT